ncbi:TetR family transcriptional regulator [Streptomyces sp. N2-109]|uniref:TetR family transcriptional regulator n=1 Tax=Streptomyces gossypii TaxID=2883101 RepID=A0ABT2JYE4_9ACTN|nr:TetR family transcriptional regulator [Streptomyces gossypii]MCT2592920.1 TetR family transcriptional regulator [Streptomyces gossypii]
MSPRGVAIPDVRERLFSAAERVLAREGPGALTGRAITGEAGCAKGMLNAHFAGLDEFLAELLLDRFSRAARQAGELPARAGQADVADNLRTVTLALLSSTGPALTGLTLARPGASQRVREALRAGAPGFAAIQSSITDYLEAERRLGRVTDGTDTAAVALALIGTIHHLLMTADWSGTPDPGGQAEQLVTMLAGAATGGGA